MATGTGSAMFDAGEPRDAAVEFEPIDTSTLSRAEVTTLLLRGLPERVLLVTYRALAESATQLENATDAYRATLSAADREAAQIAWAETMKWVERAELFQFGPAALMSIDTIGGESLRNRIYPYPQFNRCRVEVNTQEGRYDSLTRLATQPAFTRGMAAIEYLLFVSDLDHGCAPGAAIGVDSDEWSALGEDGITRARAEHAHGLAGLVRQAANELVLAWDDDAEGFSTAFATAGQAESPYESQQQALNAVFFAMLYLDTDTKDMKLGLPALESEFCPPPRMGCAELLESPYSGSNREHYIANLTGFQWLVMGGPDEGSVGFDDLLNSMGQNAVATELKTRIAESLELARALPPIDATSLSGQLDPMVELRASVGTITLLLKTQIADLLDLELPAGVPGDTDS